MIGYGNCGGAARNARRSRVRRCWMRNRPAVLRRAVRAAMMPARRSRAASANLVVDTLGLLLMVSVVPANVQDRDSADQVVGAAIDKYPSLEKLYVDSGYSGTCAVQLKQEHQIDVEVVRHPANRNVGRWVNPDQGELFPVLADSKGFVVLPKRWVVERTHAWYELRTVPPLDYVNTL